jgi:MFS superfamily sulfate permease-like transporter
MALLLGLLAWPRWPGAAVALAVSVPVGLATGAPGLPHGDAAAFWPGWSIPLAEATWASVRSATVDLALPQLSLTLTNAVVLTALLAGDYFGSRAAHVTPARLSLTSGAANLALAPLGALPMCHGAGGLAAHHRFGARTGTAPLLLALALAAVALLPGGLGTAALAAIPAAALGALLFWAAGELALSKRLFDCRVSCWPVIAATAAVTLALDPFAGLLAGSAAEAVRLLVVRRLYGRRQAAPR